jgi:phenylpropionate dioxygenase-like ring-hydroxylating dioxygenase large terminal subunit
MDTAFNAVYAERSEYERNRTGPPDDFPKLPGIPLGRYTDPQFYELEREHLWRSSWLYAAHVSEIATPGSYKLCDINGAPILVVHGDDGVVRAFYNSCRHRGAPVVRGGCGQARMLVCQYHSWGYDLCGSLVRVPDERDFVGLQRDELGLTSVRCEQWGGWIFVNLDPDAMPLLEWLHPLPTVLAEVAAAPMRLYHQKSEVLHCNWKVLAEAFLEVYHARTIHTNTVAKSLDGRGAVMMLFDHGHQNMITPLHLEVLERGREDRAVLPAFDGATELFFTTNPAHGIFPNVITPLDAKGFPFLVFWPEAIDRTRLDIVWFAPEWEGDVHPNQHVWQQRLAGFDVVMGEDYANLAPIQRSIEQAAHGAQVINYQERRIWHVHAWIDKVIGPDRIPEHLRVPDLLADWVEEIPAPATEETV